LLISIHDLFNQTEFGKNALRKSGGKQ